MELDGTDPNGDPTSFDPWSQRLYRRVVQLGGAGVPALTFGSGVGTPVDGARIVGLSIQRVLGEETTNQDLIMLSGGPDSGNNVIATSLLDGGAAGKPTGIEGIDCISARDVSQSAATTNVIRDSEVRHCRDRGVKSNRSYLRLERNWIHHNLRGGLFALNGTASPAGQPGAGKLESIDNLIEWNGRNASGQITFAQARQIAAQENGVADRVMQVNVDGDIVRHGVEGGIALRDHAMADVRDAIVCGMTGDAAQAGGQGFQVTVNSGTQPIQVRGSAFVYNNRNGVLLDGQGHNQINFGAQTVAQRGHNAFTQNNIVQASGARNFRNMAATTVEVRHNQWQRCGIGNTCGDFSADYSANVEWNPGQPHRTTNTALYPFRTEGVSPMQPAGNQLVRVRGSGFNAIEGYPQGGNCDTTAAANNRCDSLTGTCIEVANGSGGWTAIHTVQGVSPKMVAATWPTSLGTCVGPRSVRARRRGPPESPEMISDGSSRVCRNAAAIPE